MFLSSRTTSGASFIKIQALLGKLGPKKTPKMAQLMAAPSPQKLLKIYNQRTTKATKMKLGTIVQLHKSFHQTKDLGITLRAWQGVAKKPLKKASKISFLAPFLGIFRNISKTITYVIPCSAPLVKILCKSDLIWGCNIPKTTQKQP